VAAVAAGYDRGENDEFILPTVIDGVDGQLRDHDPVVHANFRADRARQLIHALVDEPFDGFDRTGPAGRPAPRDVLVVTMTEYEAGLPVLVAFPPDEVPSLAEAISRMGWRQLHLAETEKYAHVTYFFNGGREAPWPGEDRLLVPSPKVATYDVRPEMSAGGVTDALVAAIGSSDYDFIVANYANPDMVGHTGVIPAVVQAVEAADAALGTTVAAVESLGGVCLITADHGNAEQQLEPDGVSPHTAHTTNPVPLVITTTEAELQNDGALADLVPTCLWLLGLPTAEGMTGRILVRSV
jgi:2,3-bisphosphoglycerate-independent phosphoglycerate mutase